MISFTCACGESLAASPEHAGMQVQCPRCEKLLTVPAAGDEFEYADDREEAPLPLTDPPAAKGRVVDNSDDDNNPRQKRRWAEDDDDGRKPRRKKKRRPKFDDDDEPEHVRRLMDRANAELDEEEARRAKESRGIHFTPGILLGVGMFFFGITLFVVLLCLGYLSIWPLVFAGVGAVRAVLSFLGQGVD